MILNETNHSAIATHRTRMPDDDKLVVVFPPSLYCIEYFHFEITSRQRRTPPDDSHQSPTRQWEAFSSVLVWGPPCHRWRNTKHKTHTHTPDIILLTYAIGWRPPSEASYTTSPRTPNKVDLHGNRTNPNLYWFPHIYYLIATVFNTPKYDKHRNIKTDDW